MVRTFKLKVYYEDTDFSGIVYHANYFKFIERARGELVEALGIDQSILHKNKITFVVRSLSAKFIKPTFFGDSLQVETIIIKVGGASLWLRQKINKSNECVFEAEVKLALISAGQVIRLPRELKGKLSNWDVV